MAPPQAGLLLRWAMPSRLEAQRRVDRIRAFRKELTTLEIEGANPLTADQVASVAAHHDRVLAVLARRFDVDRSESAGHLSRGLRLASLFGGATLVAAIAALVTRTWGDLSLPAQVTLLIVFPLAALAGVDVAARRERTLYVSSLFALTACGTAWLAVAMTARLLDLPFSVWLLWPGIVFGLALATSHGFRLVLAVTLTALVAAVAGAFFEAAAAPWTVVVERLEPLAVSAWGLVVLAPLLAGAGDRFGETARTTGLLIGFGALLVLASIQGTSLLPLPAAAAARVYQGVMLVAALACLAHGLRTGASPTVTISATALGLFLLIRYVDWFWDVVPAWAFFLALAVLAFVSMAVLGRWRRRLEAA